MKRRRLTQIELAVFCLLLQPISLRTLPRPVFFYCSQKGAFAVLSIEFPGADVTNEPRGEASAARSEHETMGDTRLVVGFFDRLRKSGALKKPTLGRCITRHDCR